jgi:hypothetical protein
MVIHLDMSSQGKFILSFGKLPPQSTSNEGQIVQHAPAMKRTNVRPVCPGAPIKKQRTARLSADTNPRVLFRDEFRECPGAPIKKQRTVRLSAGITPIKLFN